MECFSQCEEVRRVAEGVAEVLSCVTERRICFSARARAAQFEIGVEDRSGALAARLRAVAEGARGRAEAVLGTDARARAEYRCAGHPIDVQVDLARGSRKKDCVASVGARYAPHAVAVRGGVGVRRDRALITSLSFTSPISFIAVRSAITHETNAHETVLVLPRVGALTAVKADLAQRAVKRVRVGCFRGGRQTNWYALAELLGRTVQFGMESQRSGSLRVAVESEYCYPENAFKFGFGFSVRRNICEFFGKFAIDGTIKFRTCLKPNDWMKITFSSETSAKERFNPVLFGWALDFYQ